MPPFPDGWNYMSVSVVKYQIKIILGYQTLRWSFKAMNWVEIIYYPMRHTETIKILIFPLILAVSQIS